MKIEILTESQFKNLVYKGNEFPIKSYESDLDNIMYFSWTDLTGFSLNRNKNVFKYVKIYCCL